VVQAFAFCAGAGEGDAGRGDGGADPARVFVNGKSIKEIVSSPGVSRNTVRKVLRSGETAFACERTVSLADEYSADVATENSPV
jgi:hypothetical protein